MIDLLDFDGLVHSVGLQRKLVASTPCSSILTINAYTRVKEQFHIIRHGTVNVTAMAIPHDTIRYIYVRSKADKMAPSHGTETK